MIVITEIKHLDVDGVVLWERHNVHNLFHSQGEQFLIQVAFATATGTIVPANYYLGLDNRSSITLGDNLSFIFQEPTGNGYARQPISSSTGFAISLSNNNYQATSSIATFIATGGSWGPVQNLFLATSQTSTGFLLSSVALDASRSLTIGQQLTMRLALSLINC